MSWMDSWSRPGKSSAVPPPYYLTIGESVLYCHTCGRMISPRKSQQRQSTPVKYCSERCRSHKPGPVDRKVEEVIVELLEGLHQDASGPTPAKGKSRKGDPRRLISCDEIEEIMFGDRHDPEKVFGRNKNRYSRAVRVPDDKWRSVDMESTDEDDAATTGENPPLPNNAWPKPSRPRVRPPQDEAELNFSAMGGERSRAEKIEETPQNLERRQKGQQEAEEREIVRRAARRAVVFGLDLSDVVKAREEEDVKPSSHRRNNSKEKPGDAIQPPRRKCEAVMGGQVVEPSFAKGNWSIRWRE